MSIIMRLAIELADKLNDLSASSNIQYTDVTRLCHTKSLVSVNGQFPGPTVYVREGDTVIVNVTNLVSYNVTIHWHGVRQLLSAWADGPAYITQCPIQTGHSYVHRFQVTGQRGTLFWHAHISWLRATLYGAFIIQPKQNVNYPFSTPTTDFPIVLGEWWNANVEDVIAAALASGAGYNISDALTINGQPGNLYTCSQGATTMFNVTQGKTYLLRIINAAVNFQLYFGVAGHNLTVVEADAEYTKPYNTPYIVLAPGQTTNVLLTANQTMGQYYMAASVFSPAPTGPVPFPQTATTAILNYAKSSSNANSSTNVTALGALPKFPAYNDVQAVQAFFQGLRSQSYSRGYYYMDVPQKVDEDLFFTVGYSLQPCPAGSQCQGPSGQRLSANINNVTFVDPSISLLQAYYNQINNVYQADFPIEPLIKFDYTGTYAGGFQSVLGTRVKVLKFNEAVQIVFQDTSVLFFESHPIHLHGQNFYVVGSGLGSYNASSDPLSFNLNDPPSRNTVSVPSGGWAAIRFRTTNPGVWYMHCHIDLHNSWGMSMAFIVKNGNGTSQTLPAPPADLPPC
ncbi:hypothetical protein L7F22_028605 [Adiantum nelumboides]|nr:hypothetical protein [Adiantum nelumboides]